MKFTCSVEVNLPREKVVELWSTPENLKEWQDGFHEIEHISGNPGEVGAKSRMIYIRGKSESNPEGKGKFELIETILVSNLPEEFKGEYHHVKMSNTMQNTFIELSKDRTMWTANIEYTETRGLILKIIARLFPGMFKKQVQKWMDQFKAFAEKV